MTMSAEDLQAELQRAGALCELQRFPEAITLLRTLISSEPQVADAWSLLSLAELAAKRPDAAVHAAEQAIALTPDAEWPHRLAAFALQACGRDEESARHAREAVRLDPQSWQTYATLAKVLAHGKTSLDEASSAAGLAVALAPEEAQTHIAAGVAAAAAKRGGDAERSFRHALSIDPESRVAHNELAVLSMGKRRSPAGLAAAASGFAGAVRVDPRASVSRHNLEVVMRVFLSRMAYFIFIDAFLIARIGSGTSGSGARLLPLVLLAVPCAYAWRFLDRLSRDLRSYLVTVITRDPKVRVAVASEAIAVACLVVAAVVSSSTRPALIGAAAVAGLIGRLTISAQVERHSRATRDLEARPVLGDSAMWFIVIALVAAAALLLVATASARAGAGGVVAAVLLAGAAAGVAFRIRRRQLH
jgi:tetratricopeptide (TPR) repeat protein